MSEIGWTSAWTATAHLTPPIPRVYELDVVEAFGLQGAVVGRYGPWLELEYDKGDGSEPLFWEVRVDQVKVVWSR